MDFDIVDPTTGKTHIIPYKDLPDALEAGGEFADREQQKRALFYQAQERAAERPQTTREYAQDVIKSLPGGVAQGLVNAFVSMGNLPSDIYQFATGKEGYHIPKTHFAEKDFPTSGQRMGTSIGEFGGELLAPGGAIIGGTMKASKAIPLMKELPAALRAAFGGGIAGGALSDENRMMGAATGAALAGAGAAAPSTAKFLATKKAEPAYMAQRIYDEAKKKASHLFNSIGEEVEKRGIKDFKPPKESMSVAKEYLKSQSAKAAIKKAQQGDYKALREVESKLGKAYRERLSRGEGTAAEELDEARQGIIESFSKRFEKGHEDLLSDLGQAKNLWRELKDVFEKDTSIRNIVSKHRKIPSDPLKKFGEESASMAKLMEKHPEIKQAYKKALAASRTRKAIAGTGSLIGTALGIKKAKDIF